MAIASITLSIIFWMSMEKLKAGIFDGPHIRKLNMDSYVTKGMKLLPGAVLL